eukprot:TRINITY_DN41257_c0_g1_i1.p1 TRINITY_DN41257_c0_g1~~TRINITY_DN41257_c0_g1_i1.p1  ORF type:complete len:417 (+),score=20.78 TRINITY_DN41257_c0_g1_i1:60-1310(+)
MLSLLTLGLVFQFLQERTLIVGGNRVHAARVALTNHYSELFGVSDIIPDRRPITDQGFEDVDSDAWAEVRVAILNRLGEVKRGSVDNFCWVSHDVILDDSGHIIAGGLVAVVQKLTTFRISFYRMQEFRNWVTIKDLDIGSNKRFADEQDVWVVRLTDKSDSSKEPLPDLNGDYPQGLDTVTPELSRADFFRSNFFWQNFQIPRAGQGQLIPSLVPRAGELFTFGLRTESSIFYKRWRWVLSGVRLNFGTDDIHINCTKPVLDAFRVRVRRRQKWTVRDASHYTLNMAQELFLVESSRDGKVHRLMTLSSSETLFVIRIESAIESVTHANVLQSEAPITMKVLSADEGTVLYTGVKNETPPEFVPFFMFFYRNTETEDAERLAGSFSVGYNGRMNLHVAQFTDAALLLVATALMSA